MYRFPNSYIIYHTLFASYFNAWVYIKIANIEFLIAGNLCSLVLTAFHRCVRAGYMYSMILCTSVYAVREHGFSDVCVSGSVYLCVCICVVSVKRICAFAFIYF